MAITYIDSDELVIAANHYRYSDIKNRAGIYIWNQFITEHTTAGIHTAQQQVIAGEMSTYTGDGTASKTVTLTDTKITPWYIIVLADGEPSAGWIYSQAQSTGFHWAVTESSVVPSFTTAEGSFTIADGGSIDDYNTNSATYYYIVIGITSEDTFAAGGGGSDPDWVEDGESGYGDATSTSVANKVEGVIETAFLVAHNDDGTHSTDPYSGYPKMCAGTYTGDNTAARVITLTDTDLAVKYVLLFQNSNGTHDYVSEKTDSMTNTMIENAISGMIANQITALGTGSFTVDNGATANLVDESYFYLAIGE